jgi:Taurine catabolism dioxygenase TauD, TfdA family
MYALNVAAIGGESLLASSAKIYNEIAETRPDVLHVLADDKWIFDESVVPHPSPIKAKCV